MILHLNDILSYYFYNKITKEIRNTMNNTKDTARKIDSEELKELSVVGGDDNGGNVSHYSIKTSLITLTVITISITSTFSVGEACSWPW